MAVFRADCPRCGMRSVAFTIVYEHRPHKEDAHLWDTLAVCAGCSRGILASFLTPSNQKVAHWLNSPRRNQVVEAGYAPSPPNTGAPAHTPDSVARFYQQGMDNILGNWDAAGMMFRKALDIGLKVKFPDIAGKLKERIDKAAKQHVLTADLAEWAHQIRLDGNEAAHEEEPFSKEDAERLQAFTELVLRYLFTLPGMLEKARCVQASAAPASAAEEG